MPTAVSSSLARARRSAADSLPARIIGISTFSSAVRAESRLKVWKTKPSLKRRSSDKTESGVLALTDRRKMKQTEYRDKTQTFRPAKVEIAARGLVDRAQNIE